MTGPAPVRVLIASYLEPHLVDRIRSVDPRIAVTYRADLVGQPRYPGDHTAPMKRSPAQDAEWDRLVAEAEVMFDAYRPRSDDLPRRAPHLRWIQFSSSGVAGFVHAMGLGHADVLVTNAAGIHARPWPSSSSSPCCTSPSACPGSWPTSARADGSGLPWTPCPGRRWASWVSVAWETR